MGRDSLDTESNFIRITFRTNQRMMPHADKIYSKNVQLKPICETQKNDCYIFCIPYQAFNTDFAHFGAAVFLARLYPRPEELGFSLNVDKIYKSTIS